MSSVTRPALYSETIRERWRRPRFRGELAGATATAEDVNPLCGDRVRMQVTLQDGRVSAARFVGDSCAICTASADVLSELIEGREIERPLADQRDGTDPSAAVARRHLPRHQVRVMLHVRDEDLVPRLQRPPHGLGHDRDRIGGPPREHDLLAGRGADEALDAVARDLVELGRLFPQRVDGAMHVRV